MDRLRRMQQRAKEDGGPANENSEEVHEVALFSNVALWLRNGDRLKVQLARVQKIFRVGTRGGKTDIQHPVPLSAVRDAKTFLICKLYVRDRISNTYLYPENEGVLNEPIPLIAVISVASLVQDRVTLELSNPPFTMTDEHEESAILQFVVREYKRLDANWEISIGRLTKQKETALQSTTEATATANSIGATVERAPGARRATRIVSS
jgi:hypothetical protein